MKQYLAGIVLVIFLFTPFGYIKAASTGLPFGGYVTSALVCTCPPFGVMINYGPLFLGSNIPIVGNLWFPPGAILYAYHFLGIPTTWNLGSFVPSGVCNIINPAVNPAVPCIPIPTLGTILYMGTSQPGASPK